MAQRPHQLRLNVRIFKVRIPDFGEIELQADRPAAAKYQAFKRGRESGYFGSGFSEYLTRGVAVHELRR